MSTGRGVLPACWILNVEVLFQNPLEHRKDFQPRKLRFFAPESREVRFPANENADRAFGTLLLLSISLIPK